MLHGMWDVSSLTTDGIFTPCNEVQSVNHWTTGEVPVFVFKLYAFHFLFNVFKFLLL